MKVGTQILFGTDAEVSTTCSLEKFITFYDIAYAHFIVNALESEERAPPLCVFTRWRRATSRSKVGTPRAHTRGSAHTVQ